MLEDMRIINPVHIIVAAVIAVFLTSVVLAQDNEDVLRRRLAEEKNDYIAMTKLGMICQEKVNKKEAIVLFRKAVKTNPDYPPPHLFLGRLYFLMQKTDEAVKELELFREKTNLAGTMDAQAKELYINDLQYISDIYFMLKNYDKAKDAIDEILALDASNQMACYNLGVYYYTHEHSRSRAYQYFTKSIGLNQSNNIAKKAKFAIEFMRSNPDSRIAPDISFINKEYRD